MINENELIHGVLINGIYQNEETDVEYIDICKFIGYNPFDKYVHVESKSGIEEFIRFEPVPITEDLLIKLGFEYIKVNHPIPNHKSFEREDFYLKIYNSSDIIKIWYKEMVIDNNYYHIHQLQNLYFALTGKELNTTKIL